MGNRVKFSEGEWYHCYTRGVDKRDVFQDEQDHLRFLDLLYLVNSKDPLRRDNIRLKDKTQLFALRAPHTLVSVGAYVLMPNHFHLLLYEREAGGISEFMRKLGIAYAMYFNIKNKRVGNLFVKPFRSKHVADDGYLNQCLDYIHLNPVELWEKGWKSGETTNLSAINKALFAYPFSSLRDFLGISRPEFSILGEEIFQVQKEKTLHEMTSNAARYYEELKVGRNEGDVL